MLSGLLPLDITRPYGTALVALEYSKWGAYTPHHTVGDISQQECPEKIPFGMEMKFFFFFFC